VADQPGVEPPERPSNWKSAEFAYRHPVLVAVGSGAAIAAWAYWPNEFSVGWALFAGGLVLAVQAVLWSPWGWARRRTRRLVIDPIDRDHETDAPSERHP
jgi:hypothetical protein